MFGEWNPKDCCGEESAIVTPEEYGHDSGGGVGTDDRADGCDVDLSIREPGGFHDEQTLAHGGAEGIEAQNGAVGIFLL